MKNLFQARRAYENQRSLLLKALFEGAITTIYARESLSVLHPAGRVYELRKQGYPIITQWMTVETAISKHRIAKYTLAFDQSEAKKAA